MEKYIDIYAHMHIYTHTHTHTQNGFYENTQMDILHRLL